MSRRMSCSFLLKVDRKSSLCMRSRRCPAEAPPLPQFAANRHLAIGLLLENLLIALRTEFCSLGRQLMESIVKVRKRPPLFRRKLVEPVETFLEFRRSREEAG